MRVCRRPSCSRSSPWRRCPPASACELRAPAPDPAADQRARDLLRQLLRRHRPGAARLSGPGRRSRFVTTNIDARQDPLSHHARWCSCIAARRRSTIRSGVRSRAKAAPATASRAHPSDVAACGTDGVCASPPVQSVACIGFSTSGDAGIGTGEESLFSTMASAVDGRDGIFEEARCAASWRGTRTPSTSRTTPAPLDMWVNLEFAAPSEQILSAAALRRHHGDRQDARRPVPDRKRCASIYVPPRGARLLEFASHTHKRGKRFRIFDRRFPL